MKSQKNIIELEVQQFVTIVELPHTNRKLTALLYNKNKFRRNEILSHLVHPSEFISDLHSIIDVISYQLDCIVQYAKQNSIQIQVYTIHVKCLQEANIHVFRNFNCEEINIIENCYLFSLNQAQREILNPEIEFPYSINLLLALHEDILVTIVRFEEYLCRFPTQESRNKLIQDHFMNNDYN